MFAALTRRFRFGLRSLLIAVAVIGVIAAWIGWEVRASEMQRRAIRAINQKSGSVLYDRANGSTLVVFETRPEIVCGPIVPLNSSEKDTAYFYDNDVALLAELRKLRCVDFTGSRVSAVAINEFRTAHPYCVVRP